MNTLLKKDIEIRGVLFKNFINLNEFEKDLILRWRNDKRIRRFMFKQEIIAAEEHARFLEGLKLCEDKGYWLAIINGDYIGTIDLYHVTNDSAYWGHYVNPELLGKSYGLILEYLVLIIVFDHLKLKIVKCESLAINTSVIKLHTLFGFHKIPDKEGIELMGITKEAWDIKKEELGFMLSKLKDAA